MKVLVTPDLNTFKVEIAIAKLTGSDQIQAELIQAGGETLRSEIHKLVNRASIFM
jgi:hypothetical protein